MPVRSSYLPIAWQGWALHSLFAGYLVASAYIVATHSSSLPFIAIQVLMQWVMAAVVMTWIAQRKS